MTTSDKDTDRLKWEASAELSIGAGSSSQGLLWEGFIQDTLTRGFIAGLISDVLPAIWNNLSKFVLGISQLTFTDFSSIFIYGRFSQNIAEYLFALIATFFWHGFLGIVFIFLLSYLNEKNLIFKGWLYAVGIWYFSYVITYLFQVPELAEISLNTSISNLIGASLQGLSLAYGIAYLDRKRTSHQA